MEANKQKYNGSHIIVPHGAQYKTLLPDITMPCNHLELLINHSSGNAYPMVPIGDQPSGQDIPWFSHGQSIVQWLGTCQTQKEGVPGLHLPRRETASQQSQEGRTSHPPSLWEMCWVPPARRGSLPRPVASSSPWAPPNSTSSKKSSSIAGLPNIRTNHMVTRAASIALARKPTSPHASATCPHHHNLLPLKEQKKSIIWRILLRPQVLTHVATPRVPLSA